MKPNTAAIVLASMLAAGALVACSSSSSSSPSSSGSDAPPPPPPPALGAQIDRMGRPGVVTATFHVFDGDEAAQGAAKDSWNHDSDKASWVGKYAGEVGKNLAILDGLDTNCGNQLFADTSKNDPSRYGTLASVLADDRLWLNADGHLCTIYLGVEANATGIVPNADCGGRAPSYDVMKLTYSIVARGTYPATPEVTATVGVTDGTTAVPAKTEGTTFPYLAAAQ